MIIESKIPVSHENKGGGDTGNKEGEKKTGWNVSSRTCLDSCTKKFVHNIRDVKRKFSEFPDHDL